MPPQPAAARIPNPVPVRAVAPAPVRPAVPGRQPMPAGPRRVPTLAPVPGTVRRLPVGPAPRGPVVGQAVRPAGYADRVAPRPFGLAEAGRGPAPLSYERSAPRQAGLEIDRSAWAAWLDGELLDLTYLEFQVLDFLVRHPGRVYSRAALLRHVWGHHVDDDPGQAGRTVDVLVTRLRRKLGAAHRSRIETVRRVGYRYRPAATDLVA